MERERIDVVPVPGAFELPARRHGARPHAALFLRDRARLRHPRGDARISTSSPARRRAGSRWPRSRPASRSRSASSPATTASRPTRVLEARRGTRAPRPPARRSRWPTSSGTCARGQRTSRRSTADRRTRRWRLRRCAGSSRSSLPVLDQYGPRTIAAPGLVAPVPAGHAARRPERLAALAILLRRCPRSAQSAGRARRSAIRGATRWSRRSAASTPTSSGFASS